ncbi:MAG: M23 family metallopeptidase [Deltaproteobacteria bacterium]|nr:M23 family metallopeptidase [Deltaproteobacteria bacterium]
MSRHYCNFFAVAAVAVAIPWNASIAASASASGTTALHVAPPRARPGDALLVTVSGVLAADATAASGTASAASGTASARRLRFFPSPAGAQAIVALPLELEPGTLSIEVRIPGRDEPLRAAVEIVDPAFPETKLSVEPKFIAPSPEQRTRMDEDQAAFREAFARPFEPPLFAGPFGRPRDAATTGQFGERRTFNGKKQSQHFGTDLAGAVGAPVQATNDGVVVLVRDCFASGMSIAVSHGGGLFSVYFHLSEFDVRPGDRVRRGQPIGKVGKTGRATGPHLHFGVKVGDLYVDPESVYRLAFSLPAGP